MIGQICAAFLSGPAIPHSAHRVVTALQYPQPLRPVLRHPLSDAEEAGRRNPWLLFHRTNDAASCASLQRMADTHPSSRCLKRARHDQLSPIRHGRGELSISVTRIRRAPPRRRHLRTIRSVLIKSARSGSTPALLFTLSDEIWTASPPIHLFMLGLGWSLWHDDRRAGKRFRSHWGASCLRVRSV